MAIQQFPVGSAPSSPNDRPRAQVAYEGEDEFSAMSLDPDREKDLKAAQSLKPGAPGVRPEVKAHELKSTNDSGLLGLLRKIFPK
jgi:hypothetical protein